MSVKIRTNSRLQFSRLVSISGVECWNYPEYPEIAPASDDERYIVDRNDRIDRLAFRFYGDPGLWYIIALRNELKLLPSDMYENQTLYIPSSRRVFSEILRSNKSRGVSP